MQVSVETTGTLERKMTVQVPAERVDQEVKDRLQGMTKTAKIDGFRPGKVPIKVIESKYGAYVRKEVVDQLVRSTLGEAMAQQQIEPAGQPVIQLPKAYQAGEALEYIATFEVYPEITEVQFGDTAIEKPLSEITDDTVAAVLEKLRKQQTKWVSVDRAAKKGDQVVINYEGNIDGKPFQGSEGKNITLELGSEMVVDGFDDQLTGVCAGDSRAIKVDHPKNHPVAEIAGKPVEYQVEVVSVVEGHLPALDDDLANKFGVAEGGLEGLKSEVRDNMGRELEQAMRLIMKDRVFDMLIQNNPVEVPNSMVAEEAKRMASLLSQGGEPDSSLQASVMDQARRRIALGLLVSKLVSDHGIQVDPARVRNAVELIASTYETPSEVVAWYYENPDQLKEAEGAVLEDQVVELVLEKVQIKEASMTFEEVLELRQQAST